MLGMVSKNFKTFQNNHLTLQTIQCITVIDKISITRKQVKLLVKLQQFEGTSGSPTFLFCQTVVYVPFVLGGTTHPAP